MTVSPKEILVVAGEASAEKYGARLVEKVRAVAAPASVRFYGTGGDDMQSAGVELLCHVRDLANIGPFDALSHLRNYLRAYRRILDACRERAPAAAVLIDFPDFNLRLLKKLKRTGVPVVYYISPQIWAWRSGRVRLIRRHVDKMAVILPFEVAFYRDHGVAAEFVGHPLLEDFAPERDRDAFLRNLRLSPDRPTVALLSGSRRHEVECILPLMLRASQRVLESGPAQFLVSRAQTIEAAQVARIMEETLGRADRPEFRVSARPARDLLACSDFGMVKCGTSTLEAALVGTPFLITYRIAPLSWLLGNILIRSRLKGLVNLLVGEEIVPELLQRKATPEALAAVALCHLRSPEKMNLMSLKLARMRGMLGARHASESVAAMVAGYL